MGMRDHRPSMRIVIAILLVLGIAGCDYLDPKLPPSQDAPAPSKL